MPSTTTRLYAHPSDVLIAQIRQRVRRRRVQRWTAAALAILAVGGLGWLLWWGLA